MEVYRAFVFRSGTSLCEMRSHRVKGCDWLEEITRQQRTPLYQQVTVAGRAQGSIWAHLCQSPCHSPQRRAKGLGHFHPSFSSGADVRSCCRMNPEWEPLPSHRLMTAFTSTTHFHRCTQIQENPQHSGGEANVFGVLFIKALYVSVRAIENLKFLF